jgi:SAM-dependent methyltransferase
LDDYRPAETSALPRTGERTVPGVAAENYWFRRHEAAYAWLLPAVAGRVVLEVGCGEGYGTAMMAAQARKVIGVDYDHSAVAHAQARYRRPRFVRANLAALPVRDARVDVLAGLQVIEHVWDHPQFVAECARVVRPGGALLISTPNRLTFSPGLDVPTNPFHTHEFTAAELVALINANGFAVTSVLGLHAGPRLRGLDAAYGGSFAAAQLDLPPQGWPVELARDVASIRAEDFAVLGRQSADIDTALDLIVLATPRG